MATCLGIGLHYYMFVWQPAMLDKPPQLGNPYVTYAVYACAYLVNCLLPSVPIVGGDQVNPPPRAANPPPRTLNPPPRTLNPPTRA
eukprot:6715465-Pyramimonas_sp.AAC.1